MIQSQLLNEIAPAIVKAQAEIGNAVLDAQNIFLKNRYASLSSYLEAAKPILTKNDLSLIQLPSFSEQIDGSGRRPSLTTILLHKSGQFIGSNFDLILNKQDMQSLGSAITYARRYGLASILGMGVEDDDANQATQKDKPKEVKTVGNNGYGTNNPSPARSTGHNEAVKSFVRGEAPKVPAQPSGTGNSKVNPRT